MRAFLIAAALLLAPGAALAQNEKKDPRGEDKAPQVGAAAPSFKLKTLGAPDKEVELASFKGKQPVLLIFGSYT